MTNSLMIILHIGLKMKINQTHIGQKVKITSLPDGCTSKDYNFTLNNRYLLLEFYGSCAVVKDNDGTKAYVYAGRFVA